MNPAAPSPSADAVALLDTIASGVKVGVSKTVMLAAIDSAFARLSAPAAAVGGDLGKLVRVGDLPAPITNPEAWPAGYANGFNDYARLVDQTASATHAAPVGGFVVDRYAANSWDFNGCHGQAVKALRYLAQHGRCPDGGSEFPNMECCQLIADELERSFASIIAAPPAAQSSAKDGVRVGEAAFARDPLPEERDVPKAEQGLYRKFEVRRTDGRDAPGGKHDGCDYFVLDMNHDNHASAALLAYAQSCKEEYPLLARDLLDRYDLEATTAAGLVDAHEVKAWAERHEIVGTNLVTAYKAAISREAAFVREVGNGR